MRITKTIEQIWNSIEEARDRKLAQAKLCSEAGDLKSSRYFEELAEAYQHSLNIIDYYLKRSKR